MVRFPAPILILLRVIFIGCSSVTNFQCISGDIVLTKRRLGAFAGTELEALLRSRGVTKLVLAGISTSGVVLSTLRWASDLDYDVTVLSDCCGDRDEEVHSMLMAKVFPRQATVINSASWIDSL